MSSYMNQPFRAIDPIAETPLDGKLAAVGQQYPQYNNIGDGEIAARLHREAYTRTEPV